MIRRPPRSTQSRSSAASDVYKRQIQLAARFCCQYVTHFPGASLSTLSDLHVQDQSGRHTCVCRPHSCLSAFGPSQFPVLPSNLSRCNDQDWQDENRNAKVRKGSISLLHNCHEPKV